MDTEFLFGSLCTSLRVREDSTINQDMNDIADQCDFDFFKSREYNIQPEKPEESEVAFSENAIEEPEHNERNFLLINTREQSDDVLIHIHFYFESHYLEDVLSTYSRFIEDRDEVWIGYVGMDFSLEDEIKELGAFEFHHDSLELSGVRYEGDDSFTSIYQEEDTIARRSVVNQDWVSAGEFEEVVSSMCDEGKAELRELKQ